MSDALLLVNSGSCSRAFKRGSVKSKAQGSNFPRELPSGAFWLSRESTNNDVIYGQVISLQELFLIYCIGHLAGIFVDGLSHNLE